MNDGKYRLGLIKISNEQPIPDDEPIFILRARDWNALDAIMAYADICKNDECNEYHMEGLKEAIGRFIKFKLDHPERMKQPGVTKGL